MLDYTYKISKDILLGHVYASGMQGTPYTTAKVFDIIIT